MSLHDPRWILVAWAVVAVASALRFWRLTGPFRTRMKAQQRLNALDPEKARASLERSWLKSDTSNHR
tara:strand:- start:1137 stop:1337 length:201 start_codon:yes stop_codon:yes gene_type:complete